MPESRADVLNDASSARRAASSSRTVSGRLLASYLVVLAAFAVTVGWSFSALREAAQDATLVRDAYLPLRSSIGKALAGQNVMSVQLNHITAAKNPADVRQWIETARRLRPLSLGNIRQDAERGLRTTSRASALRSHIIAEMDAIERALAGHERRFSRLFHAIAIDDTATAERIRDELVAREADAAKRLRGLQQRVDETMTSLTETAQHRERRSILALIGLSLITLVVGLLTSIYARRILAPLSVVTERARAVAAGDLAARDLVTNDDEIGELAETFEDMVAAIRKARSELVQAERLATIGKMAAHITHEVRNPLSSIGLNLELLEEELVELGPERESGQLLAAIKGEVERLSQIAEKYLAAAREPRLQLVRENVEHTVRECHDFVLPELKRAGLSSELSVDEALPAIDVDEAQLRQALLNLLRNAREALPNGGEIMVEVRQQDGAVVIHVDDDGPGIPEDVRASIFDPFYTTKQRGTGLGLALTRAIVKAHGGEICCEARTSGGTRFSIRLPLPPADLA